MNAEKTKRVAMYCRVSTDGQTVENQQRELDAVAERHGWDITRTFIDHGISGAKGRNKRPAFDELHKAIARREIDMVAAWSVDRLGRSLRDLVGFLEELNAKDVDLYLHQQGLDTSTPAGRAMFQMLGVFSEFERAMIRERVKSGLDRAKANGKKLGRPKIVNDKMMDAIRACRAEGMSLRKIATEAGCSLGTVQRVLSKAA